jgi:hypothetical protein
MVPKRSPIELALATHQLKAAEIFEVVVVVIRYVLVEIHAHVFPIRIVFVNEARMHRK